MIRGYPARASVRPGEELVLHVSTDKPRFRVVFFRYGLNLDCVQVSDWLPGVHAPERGADEDWDWPAYHFPVPEDWPSAVMLAWLEVDGGAPLLLAATEAAALFVVLGTGAQGKRRLLYKLPLATYHAYNCSGGGCFYMNPPRSAQPPGARLSLHRPGGGIGGYTWGALDAYDLYSPRQTFAHWDARFIRWMIRAGYEADYCTDFDLASDPAICSRYPLMISVGHDEYWSQAARDQVEAYVAAGGNVAFFGANLSWWRIHLVEDQGAMVCHQGGPTGAFDHWWPSTGADRPEDSMTGVSYRHGGGWWDGLRATPGYAVQDGSHWVFAGCGLSTGDRFGAHTHPPLVGYECDGVPLAHMDEASGLGRLIPEAERFGTPPGLELLALAGLDEWWQERPPREGMRSGEGIHNAAMVVHGRRGTVFTAGTTDWAQVLEPCQEDCLDRITRNVLNRLLAGQTKN